MIGAPLKGHDETARILRQTATYALLRVREYTRTRRRVIDRGTLAEAGLAAAEYLGEYSACKLVLGERLTPALLDMTIRRRFRAMHLIQGVAVR